MAKRFNFDEAITTDIKGAASDSYIGDYAMYTSKKLDKEEMNNIFATKFVKLTVS